MVPAAAAIKMPAADDVSRELTVTLAQGRALFEAHFKIKLPDDIIYEPAAQLVLDAVGFDEFKKRLAKIDEYGRPKKEANHDP